MVVNSLKGDVRTLSLLVGSVTANIDAMNTIQNEIKALDGTWSDLSFPTILSDDVASIDSGLAGIKDAKEDVSERWSR